jgi:hypothetical protein
VSVCADAILCLPAQVFFILNFFVVDQLHLTVMPCPAAVEQYEVRHALSNSSRSFFPCSLLLLPSNRHVVVVLTQHIQSFGVRFAAFLDLDAFAIYPGLSLLSRFREEMELAFCALFSAGQ